MVSNRPAALLILGVLMALGVCLLPAAARAATWYVNDTSLVGDVYCSIIGDDANSGMAGDSPLLTINAALPLANPGDTILIDAGLYAETVVISISTLTLVGADSTLTIIDPPGGSDNGISALNLDSLVVRNLCVQGAFNGINFDNCDFVEISGDSILSCSNYGIFLTNAADSGLIAGNWAGGNTAGGICLYTSCSNDLIEGNEVVNNGTNGGIYLVNSWNDTVINNVAGAGNAYGIHIYGTTGTTINDNEVSAGAYDIFLTNNADGNTLFNNRCLGSSTAALGVAAGCDNNEMDSNLLTGSVCYGLDAAGTGNRYTRNRIVGNASYGIAANNAPVDCRFEGNRIADNRDHGIFLNSGSSLGFYQNDIDSNLGYQVYLGNTTDRDTFAQNNFRASAANPDSWVALNLGNAFVFKSNWWLATDSALVRAKMNGAFPGLLTYLPYRLGAADTTMGADTIAPAAPDTVAAVALDSTTIEVSWSPVVSDAEWSSYAVNLIGYLVYRAPSSDSTSWTVVNTAGAATTSIIDSALDPFTAYAYRVTALDNASPWVNQSFYSDSIATAKTAGPDGPNVWYVNDADQANDYYCSAPGDTLNNGLTAAAPALRFADVCPFLTPGDTVTVDAGTYSETIAIDTDSVEIVGVDATLTILDFGDSSPGTAACGIFADTQTGLNFSNLTVRNCYRGLYFVGVTNSTIADVVFEYNNDRGSFFELSSNNRVCRVTARSTTSYGICMIESSLNNLVEECVSHNNGQNGICINTAHNAILRHNDVHDNAVNGLYLYACNDATVYQNESHGNQRGLYLDLATANGHYAGNNLYGNSVNNFYNGTGGNTFTIQRNYWGATDNDTAVLKIAAAGDTWAPFRLDFADTAVGADTVPPELVTGLAAAPGNGYVSLSWNAPTLDADGNALADLDSYRVYRAADPDTTSWELLASPVFGTAHTDSGIHGLLYYRVTALDNHFPYVNEGWYSDVTSGTVNFTPVAVAPGDTTCGVGEIALDATGSSDTDLDELSYLWVQVGGSPVGIITPDTAATTCTGVQPNSVYYFDVTVTDSWGAFTTDQVIFTTVDTTPPTNCQMLINYGETSTTSETVWVYLYSDNAYYMMISNDSGFSGETWVAMNYWQEWGLGDTQGLHTVYAKLMTWWGVESAIIDSSIFLDSIPPDTPTVAIQGGSPAAAPGIVLLFNLGEDTSLMQYRVGEAGCYSSWYLPWSDTADFYLSPGSDTKVIWFEVQDPYGNTTADTVEVFLAGGQPIPAYGFWGSSPGSDSIQLFWSPSPSIWDGTGGNYYYAIYWDSATGIINYDDTWLLCDSTMVQYDTGPFVTGQQYIFHMVTCNQMGVPDGNQWVYAYVTPYLAPSAVQAVIVSPTPGQRVAGSQIAVVADYYGDPTNATVSFEFHVRGDTGNGWQLIPDVFATADGTDSNPCNHYPFFVNWDLDAFPEGAELEVRGVAGNGTDTDNYAGAIVITHTTQNPDFLQEFNSDGDLELNQRINNGAEVDLEMGDTSGFYGVEIPQGMVNGSTSINVIIIGDTAEGFEGAEWGEFDTGGSVVDIELTSGQTQFGDTITITIPYADEDADSVIDGTRVRLSLVQVLYFSRSDQDWHAIARENTHVDAARRVIFAYTNHFSKFAAGKEYVDGDLGAGGNDNVPDGQINGEDQRRMNAAFGARNGQGNYNANADIVTTGTSAGRIDAEDIFEFGRRYGSQ